MILRSSHAPARRWTRQWWDSSVEVFTTSAQVKAVGLNISDGGMGLFAVANLHVGSQIEVEFRSPRSGEKHRRRGTVRHRALYLYGIEFLRKAEFGEDSEPIRGRNA